MTGGRPRNGERITTVLFDLDGTLADTAADIAAALNHLLTQEKLPTIAYERIRPIVSLGSPAMLKLAFGREAGDAGYEELRTRFLERYRSNLAAQTHLFPGMEDVLSGLEDDGLEWGVVTNKPAWLSEPLMDELGLRERAVCIISGDTLRNRKPDPEQLLYACEQLSSPPKHCVYVGDACKDIEAGKRAGMRTVVALFGYIPLDENPLKWGADAAITTPQELLGWLRLE